jgi:hypothetical protein
MSSNGKARWNGSCCRGLARMTWNFARDRFFGGGFDVYEPAVYAI